MHAHQRHRRGSILLLVLIVVPLLTLAAYSFTHWMRAEAHGAVTHLRSTQALWMAHSGVEYMQAFLSNPENTDPSVVDFENNLNMFSRIQVAPDFRSSQGFFSIVCPPLDRTSASIRYGLDNESAKIPLHRRKVLMQGSTDDQRERLMALPNMTPELADAILDWIDGDNDPRPGGAESDYYLSLANPYSPRNAAPRTLGELLLVRGVTPWLLYGEDANLDGVLNPNEDDGDRSWPPDDADGELDRGWYPFLTVYSAASNDTPDGDTKIDISGDVSSNKDRLVELFGEEWYDFLVQYKQSKSGKKIRSVSQLIDATAEVQQNQQGGGGASGGGGAPGGQAAGSISASINTGGGTGGRIVGGIGSTNAGGNQTKEIKSPWTSQNVSEYLDNALAYLSVSTPKNPSVVQGLIDVTNVPYEVVRVLPGISEQTAQSIAAAAQGRAPGDLSPAWLLTDGIVTLDEFQKIETLITTRGRVFRFESVGFFSEPGPVARVEAIIDATSSPATVKYRRELGAVTAGYPHETLKNGLTTLAPPQ